MKSLVFISCIILLCHSINADVAEDVLQQLLNDPHSKEIIEKATLIKDGPRKISDRSQSRGGDETQPAKKQAPFIINPHRGDTGKTLQQLKDILLDAVQKKDTLNRPWKKNASGPRNGFVPWRKEVIDKPVHGLTWKRNEGKANLDYKRTLYKRIMNDVNELFRLTDGVEEQKRDTLDQELSDLFKKQ